MWGIDIAGIKEYAVIAITAAANLYSRLAFIPLSLFSYLPFSILPIDLHFLAYRIVMRQ